MTDQPVTFVNIFDVDPERQEELLDLLVRGGQEVIRRRPGFRSLTLLAGADGRRVLNLARWACADDARATQNDPRAADCAARAAAIAKAAPGLYRVAAEIR
ncbi:MAG TPA: antibiotic biosynthesis monooxygenase [Pseudonocardia sp.]